MLYELLCNGQHPYPGAKPLIDEEIIDPKSVRPDLNDGLADFLRKACAPNRETRFENAAEMEAELRGIRGISDPIRCTSRGWRNSWVY